MAISFQKWTPDTCKCVLEESHNPSDPAYGVKFSKVLSKCDDHFNTSDSNLYNVIYLNGDSDQKLKNGMYKELIENNALGLSKEVTDNLNGTTRQLKDGMDYTWRFEGRDSTRILYVKISGTTLSGATRNTLNSWIITKFGIGKVIVE